MKEKEYTLILNEREFKDLKTMIVLLHIASLTPTEFTEKDKAIFSSVHSIAKKIDEIDPYNEI